MEQVNIAAAVVVPYVYIHRVKYAYLRVFRFVAYKTYV